MKRTPRKIIFSALGALAVSVSTVQAQGSCPEGRTFSGQCVNAGLAATMRQGAVVFAQPKISSTAYPVLPSDDGRFRYPHQLNPDPLKPSGIGPTINNVVIIIF